MNKYNKLHKDESNRLHWWDYGWNGAYFITICTKDRIKCFGEVKNGKMVLSPTGSIAHELWEDIPNHFPFVVLGEFVIMPDHMHGILILDKPTVGTLHATSPQQQPSSPQQQPSSPQQQPSSPQLPPSSPKTPAMIPPALPPSFMSKISPKPNSIPTIIRSYKSAVTKQANQLGLKNGWQSRYHDHIIRDQQEFRRISNYIKNNPGNWNTL